MAHEVHHFRFAFSTVVRHSVRQILFLGAFLLIAFSVQGLWAHPGKITQVLGFTLPLLLFGWLLVASIYYACGAIRPVIISPNGITASSLVGDKRSLRWDSIRQVKQIKLQDMPYWQVESNAGGPDMYISQWLERKDEFWRLVQEFAGPDHPMSRFGRERGNP
jgi:hypothetical protein